MGANQLSTAPMSASFSKSLKPDPDALRRALALNE